MDESTSKIRTASTASPCVYEENNISISFHNLLVVVMRSFNRLRPRVLVIFGKYHIQQLPHASNQADT